MKTKEKGKKLERLNLVLRTIWNLNKLLVRERDRTRLLQGICQILIENRGYYNAWIALFDDSGSFDTATNAGFGDEFLPMIEQMNSGELVSCCQEALYKSGVLIYEDPFSSCTECPLSSYYTGRAGMTVRLEFDGKIYGMLTVSVPRNIASDEEERSLFEEIAGDIAFALHNKEIEEKRTKAENALQESEKTIRQIFQGSLIPTFVIDNRHMVTHWNRACENLTGISSKEMIGKQQHWSAFYSFKRPLLADLIVDNSSEEEIDTYYKGHYRKSDVIEGGFETEYFFPTLGERGKYLSITAAPLRGLEGKITGAIQTMQDVTSQKEADEALRESEQRFRDLVENSLIGISIIQNNKIVYQNPAQERLIGPLPRKMLFIDLERIHPDDVEKVKRLNQEILAGNERTLDADFRFYPVSNRDDRYNMKWVYCRTSLVEYRGEKAVLFTLMDMTRAKEMEHLLRIQDKMASLGHVAAGIAHEIRNPLSGINIYLNTLEKIYDRSESFDKVKAIIEHLQSASAKIESVIRRVMDFSKPSEPKLVLTTINNPIEEALQLSSVTLRKKGIKVENKLLEDLPPCDIDPHMIEQVILNLLTNAAEAMKNMDGEKIIAMSSSIEDKSIVVKVSDSGPGVSLNRRDKIFDPFYTTKNGSTGIGLSLSHRIITDHGGSLSVSQSELGGAEFVIEIPIKNQGK